MNEKELMNLDDYITTEEKEHLLNGLHRYLIWVGERVPDEVQVGKETIKLHDLIWRCIHKKELSVEEKNSIMELVNLLETKARHDEEILLRENMTRQEAKRLYNEIASFIRAIMDLKECEEGRVKLKESTDEIKQKIEDAKRWIGFLKNVGRKSTL